VPAELGGRVALVTGVGRVGQVGHAVAQGLGAAGARLVLADLNVNGVADRVAEFTARGFAAHGFAGDLSTEEGARGAVAIARQAFGGLDVVVNVAGGLVYVGPFAETPPDAFEKEFTINVRTAFHVCRCAIPLLVERGGGAIVNFASIAVVRSIGQMASYSAAKSAVAGLTRALAREFRDAGVRVNAVAPATIRTADNVAQMKPDPKTPLVELDEVVGAVVFLASDAARGITGQIVPITGKAY
jgi:NAD(P)-dependent dehydrogenase (short-subunit alcohol dehydrogenase family)